MSDFYLGKYEVTFKEYDQFCEEDNRRKPDARGWGRDNRPVINVSWNDADAFCKWLSKKSGKKYHLPTEAEWEYAARAGGKGGHKYPWGNDAPDEKRCNFNNNSGTVSVGQYSPNGLGLYDMAGNVWEWCSDWYSKDYYEECKNKYSDGIPNPTGPDESSGGSGRV